MICKVFRLSCDFRPDIPDLHMLQFRWGQRCFWGWNVWDLSHLFGIALGDVCVACVASSLVATSLSNKFWLETVQAWPGAEVLQERCFWDGNGGKQADARACVKVMWVCFPFASFLTILNDSLCSNCWRFTVSILCKLRWQGDVMLSTFALIRPSGPVETLPLVLSWWRVDGIGCTVSRQSLRRGTQ